jgi:hypothetical protein
LAILIAACRPRVPELPPEQLITICGGANDQAVAYATVCGGSRNSAMAIHATVGGGHENVASVEQTTISGGHRNAASGPRATVAGGYGNMASRVDATVSGGGGNTAGGTHATVSGGSRNVASGYDATVSGGSFNLASGTQSVVGGGYGNQATDFDTTVAGGAGNTAGGTYAAVGGGLSNGAVASYATVSGGYRNTASGSYSTVPGGSLNQAAADLSLAAGQRATVDPAHRGAFLYADASDYDFHSTAANEFAVRATGGVRFVTGLDGGGGPAIGVALAPGSGSWSSLSDRGLKTNVTPVDGSMILEQLAQLPVSTWSYTGQDPSFRHIGPVAQDFYAAFGVGEDEAYISAIDADGVALAAIQGLYQLVQEQESRIRAQERQIEDLEARLTVLEGGRGPGGCLCSPSAEP